MFFYNESDSEVSQVNPPTSSDPYFYNTSLLLKMDSDFSDSSTHQHSVTVNGMVSPTSTESKYGGASGDFTSTGKYLEIADHDSLSLSSTDLWTIECWIHPLTGPTGYRAIISKRTPGDSNNEFEIFLDYNTGNLSWVVNGVQYDSNAKPTFEAWNHIAYQSDGSTTKYFLNGSLVHTTTARPFEGSAPLFIGSGHNGGSSFVGYIDDVRITKGVARYADSFTPPDSHPTTGPGVVSTDLQLHLDASDTNSYSGTGTTWLDLSGNGNTFETYNVALEADGDLKYFNFANNNNGQIFQNPSNIYDGVKDHTFEAWIRMTSTSSYQTFLSYATTNSNANELMMAKVDNYLRVFQNNDPKNYTSVFSGTSANEWFHLVVSAYDDTLKVYINTTEVKSSTRVGNSNMAGGGYLLFGQDQDSLGGGFQTSQRFIGDISQMRIYTNKGLTSTEVLQNYNATKSSFGL